MSAGRVPETPDIFLAKFHLVSNEVNWNVLLWLVAGALLYAMLGTGSYPLLGPDEARHAGIVHDMWAARQYLVPRVDGLPMLDGAPLFYWLSLASLFFFGAEEWAVRLPSAIAAALTLGLIARIASSWLRGRALATLIVLFLTQPALVIASRFASPDMLNIFLLTLSVGSFLNAVLSYEAGRPSPCWLASAWVGTALLGLGAGALAVAVPLLIVSLWLALRGRFDSLSALRWWPGLLLALAPVLSWLWAAGAQYPGIVSSIFENQAFSLLSHARHGWGEISREPCALLVLGGVLPVTICLYRYRDPARRQAARTPEAGLMAVGLLLLVPLYPWVVMSVAGTAAILTVPLLYFGMLALTPGVAGQGWADIRAWLVYLMLIVVVSAAGLHFFSQRVSTMPPVVQVLSEHYNPATDKVILLDRYDYELSFYLRSPKLVYVVSDWIAGQGARKADWQRDLLGAARFAPETAQRLLLTYEGFLQKLCERRVVNLWVIGSDRASLHHPVLLGLTPVVGTGTVRAWYLDAGEAPRLTSEGDPLAGETCAGVR